MLWLFAPPTPPNVFKEWSFSLYIWSLVYFLKQAFSIRVGNILNDKAVHSLLSKA